MPVVLTDARKTKTAPGDVPGADCGSVCFQKAWMSETPPPRNRPGNRQRGRRGAKRELRAQGRLPQGALTVKGRCEVVGAIKHRLAGILAQDLGGVKTLGKIRAKTFS